MSKSLKTRKQNEKFTGKDCVALLRSDGHFINGKGDSYLIQVYGTANPDEIEALIDKQGWEKFYPNLNL